METLTVDRNEIIRGLREAGVLANVHYIPVHLHPYYRDRFGLRRGDFPRAERAFERLVTIPLFPAMTKADQDRVTEVLSHLLGRSRR